MNEYRHILTMMNPDNNTRKIVIFYLKSLSIYEVKLMVQGRIRHLEIKRFSKVSLALNHAYKIIRG